jgi:hypothetical protein
LNRIDVENIALKFGIDIVPILGTGTLPEIVENAKCGFKSTWGNFIAEGYLQGRR